MAEQETDVREFLKDFSVKVQTSKVTERKCLYAGLEVFLSKELPAGAVLQICYGLLLTLPRYIDNKSRSLVKQCIRKLLEKQATNAKPALVKLIQKATSGWTFKNVTKSTAKMLLTPLSWSILVAQACFDSNDVPTEFLKCIIETQANLLFLITEPKCKSINRSALKKITLVWKLCPASTKVYAEILNASETTLPVMVLWGFLYGFWSKKKEQELSSLYKDTVLQNFAKIVLGSKTKVPSHVVDNSKFLRMVNHDDFQQVLLPVIIKSMLRNPENILETVSQIIATVTIDLSKYSDDLGKSLAIHLISKTDECRDEAANGFKYFALQCSDPESIGDLINYLFKVLNGSEGKLTIVTQRLGVLTGIGNLSYIAVRSSTSLQILGESVAEQFINVLKQETHEGTIIHALKMLSFWCPKFTTSVPDSLMKWFKVGIAQKTSTPAVRVAYLECMLTAFQGNTLLQGLEMTELVSKALDRAFAQATQPWVVSEGLVAACIILKLYSSESQAEIKLKSQMHIILDIPKLPFLAEKFLHSAPENALNYIPLLTERLVLDHDIVSADKMTIINKGMLYCLTHPSHHVRQKAKATVCRLVSVLGGSQFAIQLLKELPSFISKLKLVNEGNSEDKDNKEQSSLLTTRIAVLKECLFTICSGKNMDQSDSLLLGIETLLPAHLSPLYETDPIIWPFLLKKLNLVPETFAQEHKLRFQGMTVLTETLTPMAENAVSTLSLIAPFAFLPVVIDHISNLLRDNALFQVTMEEYCIFMTPEGELCNKSAIENVKDDSGNIKNVKRESKLYSYKDQMEEQELRKELDAKKKAKGHSKEPELTKKQIEVMKAELKKEAGIRERIKKLSVQLERAVLLLRAAIRGNSYALSSHITKLVSVLLPLIHSPLCAPSICKAYLDLRVCVVEPEESMWGLSIAYLVLRVLDPKCSLDPAWVEEDLDEVIQRHLDQLHKRICTDLDNDNFQANEAESQERLSTPTFAYIFPLIHSLLINPDTKESIFSTCLELISTQVSIESQSTSDSLNSVELPFKQMLDTLVQSVEKKSGKNEILASKALLDVCNHMDREKATMNEIRVLLIGLQSSKESVREASLKGLSVLKQHVNNPEIDSESSLLILRRLWVARFDIHEDNLALANQLWTDIGLTFNPMLGHLLLSDVVHPEKAIREAGARSLAAAIKLEPDVLPVVIHQLLDRYDEELTLPPPVLDNFGRLITESPPDHWESRSGIAIALKNLSGFLTSDLVFDLINFFVSKALGDRNADVRKAMLDASVAVVDIHGKDSVNTLLPIFEEFLDKAPDSSSFDAVRQSVVILMGTLARHLEKFDPKIKPIVHKLIETLSTPSEQVQEAVANCLPPLVPAMKDEAPALVQNLLHILLESENYGERRGAAYGLAGLVKGLGILSLKQLEIMNTLTTAIQDKKNYRRREGSLLALEMLCTMLGRLFEPYIVHILPHLLLCFGDGNQYVREATDNTAKAVMSKLSAHGVKLVLPSLLAALEEDSWRTKAGSVELLGAMAFCAPKQLSSCLPSIVPKLIEVLSDSHTKVQKSGAQALKLIGSVIRNPEIQAIVPELLDALQDPSKKTSSCLSTLLNTRLVHFIDAPSLALIMPVVQRSFQDRSTWTRKMAARIIGNMYSLTDQKDLAPYLPTIIPGLKQSLLDPVPEVRSVSARALGALVKGMGESSFEDLLPWLMHTLTSESSPVDRSGAAQGLSEVMGSLGVEKLEKLMPEIISTAERQDIAPHVKDGYIMMFIYLPVVFTKEFTQYIGQIITPILKALADENEYVRETAMKAGQRIVNMYADTAITLLLPELENGLFDVNWRIRHSSVHLLGDLMFKISGVSGKMSTETADEDDNFGTEHSHKAILLVLGAERRNRVLAGLYMGRSDVALMVRQAALHVWKVVVTNTPRTLREILPTLFSLLLGCLASNSFDKQQVAARTLGDLVRKLGERVLPEIIPILERGLDSDRADQRQGVCIGLSEIMASTSRDMVLTFVDSLVPTVKRALTDPLPEVRQAAAKTFDSLHSTVGAHALDDIIPPLLKQLSDPELAEFTLDGLKQVMAIKSKVVLPYIVPQLTSPPVNTKALAMLSGVAGDALTRHLNRILPALLQALSTAQETSTEAQELEYCQAVVLSVTDEVGVRTIIDHLLEASKHESLKWRRASVSVLSAFCTHTKADISPYVSQLLRGLIHLFTEEDPALLQVSWETLNAVIKTLDSTEQVQHVVDIRQAVRFAVSDLKGKELLPGFCLPKGITPILPVFRDAILNGVPELKEQAAQGLGEVIRLTSPEALKPSVVHITGPLIRILGDRFSWNVKVAILETLALLLEKVGLMLKPFLPQLQTTFLKALSDGHRLVRLRAATALSHLIGIHTRCDPLFTDLHNAVRNTEDTSIKETMLHALRCVVTPAGDKMSEPIRTKVVQTLTSMIGTGDDSCRMIAAGSLGSLLKWLPEDELNSLAKDYLLDDDLTSDWILRHGKSVTLMIALKEAAPQILQPEWMDRITKTLTSYMSADRLSVVFSGIRGTGYYLLHVLQAGDPGATTICPQTLLTTFAKNMNHSSNEVKQVVALTCNFLGKHIPGTLPAQFIRTVIPMLVNGTKEKNTVVKANSEYALVTVLHMRQGETTQQACMALLDAGPRDSLHDVIHKVLRKVAAQPEPKEEELDDTLLT